MLSTAQLVFEYGDKNGKLLAWLSRRQFSATHIGRIQDEKGAPLVNPEEINHRFMQYYRTLYSTRVDYEMADLEIYLDGMDFPTLSKGG